MNRLYISRYIENMGDLINNIFLWIISNAKFGDIEKIDYFCN